ncbi:protein WVD2-like 7 isoform X1 [Rhododendron vialii]|uniref:protein WVD2-like 7 isoform X1 n=1 Tax=Rhododendron vialii TaxID=182163 RepID=UPI00265E06AE|nr:protein WVD2-like 7 isoform X1 [Rhododendron vialii]
MGESACVMHTFSYASGISNESKQGNPVPALGESISFGRFMTESLSWEKWSTFSHNRYVEEAERYAKPGSVAQKKAFFEAHYKRIAAAKKAAAEALLEQKAANTNPDPQVVSQDCSIVTHQSQSKTNLGTDVDSMKGADTVTESEVSHQPQSMTNLGREVDSMKEADTETESEVVTDDLLKNESLNHSENVVNQTMDSEMGTGESPQMEKPLLQGLKPNHEATLPSRKKKPAFSSSKPSTRHRAPKVPASPAKSTLLIHPGKENNDVTPITRSSPTEAANKKRPTSKSLRTLIYSTPAKEPDKSTTLAARKAESSRVAPSSYNFYNDCKTPLRTPKMAHTDGVSKNPSATPFSENRRTTTPMDASAVGSKTTGPKWNIISSVSSKSLTACKNKLQSPNLSAPFSFRTEERAAQRKQKLEEKFNAKETQKVQLQTRLKEKAETEIRRFRQTLCFKARPMPDFYKARESPINQIKSVKTPLTQPQSLKVGRKPSYSTLQGLISLPQEAHSTKTSRSKNTPKIKNRMPNPLNSLPEMTTCENTTPNIQLDRQQQK